MSRASATRFINWSKNFKLSFATLLMKLSLMKLSLKSLKLRHFIPVLVFPPPVALWGALAFLLVATTSRARGDELSIPIPPQQYTPWKAPVTKLPVAVVNATKDLFLWGLADPRGCDYREITVTTGDVWGRVRDVQTHGWVLPRGLSQGLPSQGLSQGSLQGSSQSSFAIAWNGLIYPLKAAGPPADLRGDLAKTPAFEIRQALPEAQSVNVPPRSLIGVCLLLRLGESAGAETLWRMARRSPLARPEIKRAPPLEELSSHWAWALWDRALGAHLRGDDRLALRDARQVRQLQPLVEFKVRAARLKAKNRIPFRLMFLAPLPRLLKDQERRAKGIRVLPKDDIALLIVNLENVTARQWGQPGSVDLTTAPVVQELVAQGRLALPALLDVMEKDQRLTRSVSFHRDYFTQRHLIGTGEAAYAALRKITGQSFGPMQDIAAGGNKRLALVQRARAKWLPRSKPQQITLNFAIMARRLRERAKQNSTKSLPVTNFNLLFEPLWRYPSELAFARLGQDLFTGSNPFWNPLIDPRRAGDLKQGAIIAGPLLTHPAYRAQVARQLKNWSHCGTVEIIGNNRISIQTPVEKREQPLTAFATLPVGSKEQFRVCDFYAWQLSQIKGAPRCELYWPFAKRDRAVGEMALWLQAYGTLLKPTGPGRSAAALPVEIVFPLLQGTAKPEDVKKHRAIFSLPALSKTRLPQMKLPAQGRWKNEIVQIWQAEEIAVGTQWRRYYGIVARHEMRRVPAGEIELLKAE